MSGKLLFHNSCYSNVILHIGTTQKPLHKEILEQESEFFASLLGDRWCQNKSTPLELRLEERNDFELFLATIEVMYTHQLPNSVKNDICQALEMLRISYELLFEEGIKLCSNAVVAAIQKTPSSLSIVTNYNSKYGFKELQQMCDKKKEQETLCNHLQEFLRVSLGGNKLSQKVLQQIMQEEPSCFDGVFGDNENVLTPFVSTWYHGELLWFGQQLGKTSTKFQGFIITNTFAMQFPSSTPESRGFVACLFALLPKVLQEGNLKGADLHTFCTKWLPLGPDSISNDAFKTAVEGIMKTLGPTEKFGFIVLAAKNGREVAVNSLASEAVKVLRQMKGTEKGELMQIGDQ